MKYTPELKGKTFERWTIIGKASDDETLYNKFKVKCKCQCGTIRDVLWRSLIQGTSLSCGCLNLERSKEKLTQVLPIGSIFGKWTVIGPPISRNKSTFYLCHCECGTEREVNRYSLVTNKSMSCGCLQSKGEYSIKQYLQDRQIIFETQYSFDDCRSPKNRKLKFDFAVFDDEGHLELIIEFQGSQHTILNPKQGKFVQSEEKFQTTQLYDKIKQQFLTMNKIPHVFISYKEIRDIGEILDNLIRR
jgi:hypothetical protein